MSYKKFIEIVNQKKIPTIYFVRHAESEGNTLGPLCTASQETALTPNGESVAKSVGQWFLKHEKHSAIFSSPKERTLQTATAIADSYSTTLCTVPRLSERDWGVFNTLTWKELSDRLSQFDINDRYQFVPDGGESWQAMEQRIFSALIECINKTDYGTTIIVVTHGGCLRALLPLLAQKDFSHHEEYSVPTGSISKFLPHENELEFFGKMVV